MTLLYSTTTFSEPVDVSPRATEKDCQPPRARVNATLADWPMWESGTSDKRPDYWAMLLAPTSASAPDYQMALLQLAADQSNEAGYLAAYRQIDWAMRTAADILLAVQWALQAEAHGLARELSQLGAERYPTHAELQKYARVLAPPKIIARDLPPRPDLRANHLWMKQNSALYRGQWIALRNGQLLATAQSFTEITERFSAPQGIFFTKIF